MASSSKSEAQFGNIDRFTFPGVKMAYQNNFFKKNILGKRDVLLTDLLDPTSMFIEDIFMKKKNNGVN